MFKMAKSDSRSFVIVVLKNDFIRFKALKSRSSSQMLVGIVRNNYITE